MDAGNKSFIFLIGMANKNLSGHLYQLNDSLPSAANFQSALKGVKPIYLPGFFVNLEEMTFSSELLKGSFSREGDGFVIQTDPWEGNGNQPLFLRPMAGK